MSRLQLLGAQLPKLAMPSMVTTPTTFPMSSKLAPELRNKIWGVAAMEAREKLYDQLFKRNPADLPDPPSFLSANREARSEGMRYYTKCRESKFEPFGHGTWNEMSHLPHITYEKL